MIATLGLVSPALLVCVSESLMLELMMRICAVRGIGTRT